LASGGESRRVKRALVVDDDHMMVRTLCDILRAHGWDAVGAHSGEEGVQEVAASDFHAVLMDVRMDGINGVDALRQMKRIRPSIRVVLMTAYAGADLLAQAEREGALSILAKPVAIPSLVQMLNAESSAGRRVLVVDDNPEYLSTLCSALRSAGYTVFDAQNLGEALSKLEEEQPTVVVLDHRLQDVDVGDSVVAIKRVSPAVALILYSGHTDLSQATAGLPRAWIHACLKKPFSPLSLIGLLNDIFA
jgi:DNA-binding NtrC family response regulator